jgi:26S proteasome regulatory subunit N10
VIQQKETKISFPRSSFDNSDYQRNGDYLPTRLNAQKDGINLVCLTKLRSNPENNVGLLTLAK